MDLIDIGSSDFSSVTALTPYGTNFSSQCVLLAAIAAAAKHKNRAPMGPCVLLLEQSLREHVDERQVSRD